MVGEYKVSFEFIETFGSNSNYKLDNPYQSWGTEMVIVLSDEPNYISLQHIMMMYFEDNDGVITGPYIQKHWRQDWAYEDPKILNYKKIRPGIFQKLMTIKILGANQYIKLMILQDMSHMESGCTAKKGQDGLVKLLQDHCHEESFLRGMTTVSYLD